MINFNGNIVEESNQLSNNRGFLFGDAVFETLRLISNKIIFWEDHYFRLMASMRILRFDIPEYFTCLLYTSPSPRDVEESRMPSSA